MPMPHRRQRRRSLPVSAWQKFPVVAGARQQLGAGRGQQLAAEFQLAGALAVGQEAVVTDALETRRRGVLQEAADEFLRGEVITLDLASSR